MHADHLRKPLERLRRALAPDDTAGLGDAQLLARFVADRDQRAFAALVRRHGPLVLGVCRRLLRHQQDAEDCFQAAFLVLARRAGSVRQRASLASWLYGVAYRVARDAASAIARRRSRERQVERMPHPEVPPQEPQDWRPLLDQELMALPEKFRAAVVLCDLEGRTRKEAACVLKIPEGTLSSRLAAGRRLLAQRLTRRGLAHTYARELHHRLRERGLIQVENHGAIAAFAGGSPGADLQQANFRQVHKAAIEAGLVTQAEYEEVMLLLSDPQFTAFTSTMFSAMGRKPKTPRTPSR